MDKLNPNQLRFCQEYVIDLNGQAAAERAGYSKTTAKVTASRLLTHDNIKAEIARLQAKVSQKLEITAENVVREMALCGFSNMQDYITAGNQLVDLTELPREKVAAVKGIKITEIKKGKAVKTTKEFILHDKPATLNMIGKHLGIYEKNNNQKVTKIIVKKK